MLRKLDYFWRVYDSSTRTIVRHEIDWHSRICTKFFKNRICMAHGVRGISTGNNILIVFILHLHHLFSYFWNLVAARKRLGISSASKVNGYYMHNARCTTWLCFIWADDKSGNQVKTRPVIFQRKYIVNWNVSRLSWVQYLSLCECWSEFRGKLNMKSDLEIRRNESAVRRNWIGQRRTVIFTLNSNCKIKITKRITQGYGYRNYLVQIDRLQPLYSN